MTVTIIGIGNRFRRDDGIGSAVVERLHGALPAGYTAKTCACEPATLVEAMRGAGAAILVDAAAPAGRPGRITRIDASAGLSGQQTAASTHGFGLTEALALSTALGVAPANIVLFAVEGVDFRHGEGLSPTVEAALPALIDAVSNEARAIALLA